MNAGRKSDERVVPVKLANKGAAEAPAESAEERRSAKWNTKQSNLDRTQSRKDRRSSGLRGVREAARKNRQLKFTALLHHVDVSLLRSSFFKLKKTAAVGVDGVTWREYERDLEARLVDLHGRIHRGAFRAQPSKRVYIEKADGKQRPLGIPSLEDKIVQHAVRAVLESIYEEDFLGFSYGFRPRRSQHQALDALYVAITEKRVNWVLDADIQGFFDNIDRDWLVKFIEHRVGDKRLVRLIQKWLNAGIIEGTEWSDTGRGTPQGAVLSPLLANVFLHYVLDQWFHQWRTRHARGSCVMVRYADDFVIGFEYESDALACQAALTERLTKFGLNLHPTKTRLLEFGRDSAIRREREGRGKCETFNFLGFTHICSRTHRTNRFTLLRLTMASRMRRTLAAIKQQLVRRRHAPVGQTGRWLASVVRGWQAYHGVPRNFPRLGQFHQAIFRLWLSQLRRRSQRGRRGWTWERMGRLLRKHLPAPRISHPWPDARFRARHAAGAV